MSLRSQHSSLELADRLRSNGEYERAVRILACTIFRMMTARGYESRHVIQLSSELLHQITVSLRAAREEEAETSIASTPVYQESA